MPLTRVASWNDAKKGAAVTIEIDRLPLEISHASLTIHDTPEKIVAEIERQASLSATLLPKLFIHQNRDGSIAIATGADPKTWPEDDPFGLDLHHMVSLSNQESMSNDG